MPENINDLLISKDTDYVFSIRPSKVKSPTVTPTLPNISNPKITPVPAQEINKERSSGVAENGAEAGDDGVILKKTLERMVNGKKQTIAECRDKDNKKVYYLYDQNAAGGIGEKLVTYTTTGKDTYITTSEMNENFITPVFPNGLPDGVEARFVQIDGNPTLIFKKEGQTLDQSGLRELVKANSSKSSVKDESCSETPVSVDIPAETVSEPQQKSTSDQQTSKQVQEETKYYWV